MFFYAKVDRVLNVYFATKLRCICRAGQNVSLFKKIGSVNAEKIWHKIGLKNDKKQNPSKISYTL